MATHYLELMKLNHWHPSNSVFPYGGSTITSVGEESRRWDSFRFKLANGTGSPHMFLQQYLKKWMPLIQWFLTFFAPWTPKSEKNFHRPINYHSVLPKGTVLYCCDHHRPSRTVLLNRWAAKLFLFGLESITQLISAKNTSRSRQISSFQFN